MRRDVFLHDLVIDASLPSCIITDTSVGAGCSVLSSELCNASASSQAKVPKQL